MKPTLKSTDPVGRAARPLKSASVRSPIGASKHRHPSCGVAPRPSTRACITSRCGRASTPSARDSSPAEAGGESRFEGAAFGLIVALAAWPIALAMQAASVLDQVTCSRPAALAFRQSRGGRVASRFRSAIFVRKTFGLIGRIDSATPLRAPRGLNLLGQLRLVTAVELTGRARHLVRRQSSSRRPPPRRRIRSSPADSSCCKTSPWPAAS